MKLRNFFKKLSLKRTLVGVVVAVAVLVPVVVHVSNTKAGYGPDRPRIYDWNNEADQTGALTPTLNSFINTTVYGDERNLTRIAPVVANQSAVDADYSKENVTANADAEYWVRVYVHNDANQDLNDADHNYAGVATNTKVRVAIAEGQANGVDVMGYISADNTTPLLVWDTGTLVNDTQKFEVTYQNGSAMIVNQAHLAGAPLSDAIVSADGVQIGYDQMNGNLPGCFQYSAYVFVKVKVNTPKVQISKISRQVAVTKNEAGQTVKTGVGEFSHNVTVKTGDLVSFKLDVQNTGSAQADNTTIRDTLPNGLTLDPGSILYISSAFPDGKALADTDLNAGGANVGSFTPNGNGVIYLRAVVGKPADDTCKIVNTAYVKADNSSEVSDSVTLTFDSSVCNTPVVFYECTLLTLVQDKSDKHKVVATITANHDSTTKISSYVIDFGDGTTPLTTNQSPYTYVYKKDSKFNVVAKVNFTLADSTPKNNIASNGCIKSLTITSTPPTLPDTGAGSTIAIFFGATFIGAFLYRMRALRSLR